MSKLQVQIRYTEELEEWLPSYPGDPLVRPASYSYEIRYSEREPLEQWLNESVPGYRMEWGVKRYPTGVRLFNGTHAPKPIGWQLWYEGKVFLKDKSQAILFKLAFG